MSHKKNTKRKDYPGVSQSLLNFIEAAFPNQLPPENKATKEELDRRIGAQRVVNKLRSMKEHNETKGASNNSVHPIT